MNLKSISKIFVILIILLTACERKSRPLSARKELIRHDAVLSEDASVLNLSNVSSISGIHEVLPKKVGDSSALNGEALYKTHCAACHQLNGQGLPGVFPPLAKSPYVDSKNKERMAAIMMYGLMGPVNVLGTTYNNVMSAVGMSANIPSDELSALSAYVRSSWGNKSDPIEPSVFDALKAKYGTRGPFTIQELGEEK
jgi:mono/diheme cytochrome c family protein